MPLLKKDKKEKNPKTSVLPHLFILGMTFFFLLSWGGNVSLKKYRVRLGNEVFLEAFPPELQEKRLGLVINHTSRLSDGTFLVDALLDQGHSVSVIFSPEHGFSGNVEGGIGIKDSRFKDIEICSLYGKTKKPTPEQCQKIDVFIYDIQDVGTRFYTYITTLKYVLEAAAEVRKPVYVLDRPNPAGGLIIEGPLMRPEFESFIGALPIPVRYGLTAGELALMMKGEDWVGQNVDLRVIRMENWDREYFWNDTHLPWAPPSPNILTAETTIAFPGTGLLGGIDLNQGLGTCHPFLQFGAPWLEVRDIIRGFNGGKEFWIKMEATAYRPRSIPGKVLHPAYENKSCQGIRIHIKRKEKFLSLRFTLALIKALKRFHPQSLVLHSKSLNQMFGNDLLVRYLKGKTTYQELLNQMEKDENSFRRQRRRYLLYEKK